MAIIEEISWEEAQQHLASLGSMEGPKLQHETTQWDLNATIEEDLYPPCLVEEEAPPEASAGKEKIAGLASSVAGDSSNQAPNVSREPDQPPAVDSSVPLSHFRAPTPHGRPRIPLSQIGPASGHAFCSIFQKHSEETMPDVRTGVLAPGRLASEEE
jgi:hypothetical protein